MSCGVGVADRLASDIAVAVAKASSCSSDLIPSLGISICCGCGPLKKKKKSLERVISIELHIRDTSGHLLDIWIMKIVSKF